MASDSQAAIGVYFGTTSGELWGSSDEGDNFARIAGDLPHIYAVTVSEIQ